MKSARLDHVREGRWKQANRPTMPSDLDPDVVASNLTTKWLGRPYFYQAEVDSTNTRLRELATCEAIHGTVLAADQQSAGRGRLGRIWQSPAGVNLYFSVLLRPTWSVETTPLLSLVAGVAVAEAVERTLTVPLQLKWPNDVYFQRRKLAGILAETGNDAQRRPYVVLGIGLNVNQHEFPTPLELTATSLCQIGGREFSRNACLAAVLDRLEFRIEQWQESGIRDILDQWVSHANWLGKPIKVQWGTHELCGTAVGLSPDGGLRLLDQHGTERTVYCGDTSLLLETIREDSH